MAYDLSDIHKVNLKILERIDYICRKYDIKYSLDAGTLLGAVRHAGFIPWDDDADIVFTRDNFNKFAKAAKKELPSNMELLMPDNIKGGTVFYDFTPRILYLDSKSRNEDEMMKYYDGKINHLWVDLFIIDEISEKPILKSMTILKMKIIYAMAMGHRYKLDFGKYSIIHKIIICIVAGFGKLIPMKKLFKMQEKLAIKYNGCGSNLYYYPTYQPDYLYVMLPREWCIEYEETVFEDLTLMIPKGWHNILEMLYGKYRELPPENERCPAHVQMEELWIK